ncbi:uncharacterized protein EI97DRAFT_442006 [Westerdykella ornata]|uniref:Uncharacterized protein n=1 Tax=Westerdykella ornata TaxID=318751 RepID=A0A6A6JL90_WESOR|nr:uncharacterized protein EI97DRAFT_442006 [Westerdykella ornata]KAF2277272.1 hypothetical protein EI97DRAFT_442006 [Westerdykella ornata]
MQCRGNCGVVTASRAEGEGSYEAGGGFDEKVLQARGGLDKAELGALEEVGRGGSQCSETSELHVHDRAKGGRSQRLGARRANDTVGGEGQRPTGRGGDGADTYRGRKTSFFTEPAVGQQAEAAKRLLMGVVGWSGNRTIRRLNRVCTVAGQRVEGAQECSREGGI